MDGLTGDREDNHVKLLGSLIFLALCAALPGAAAAQGGPAGVEVETVALREMAETVPVFAEVVTARDGIVAARVSGLVAEVHVLEGAVVAAGDPLVSLDTELTRIEERQARARMTETQAGIDTERARLDRLEAALIRVERLRGTAAYSQGRFEEAEGEVLTARGQLAEAEARAASAEADLAEVEYRLAQAQITAPFDGVVLSVETNPGEFISAGAPLARLLDTTALEVEASVPSRYGASLAPGVEVGARTDGGASLRLTVRAVLPTEDPATRTRPVRLTADDPAALGAVGASITVDIPTAAPRKVLAVPKDALVQAQGGWTVFVEEDGAAQPRSVTVGAATEGWFEVLSGLAEGDRVVTRGNERLRPGQPIAAAQGQ